MTTKYLFLSLITIAFSAFTTPVHEQGNDSEVATVSETSSSMESIVSDVDSIFTTPTNQQGGYFEVATVSEVSSWMESMVPDAEPPYYKIRLKGDDSELGMIVYPPMSDKEFSGEEIVSMIEELLKYKGDTRKCFMKIKCNSSDQLGYAGNKSQYSLQLEALYIINSLFFENFAKYSPCPLLVDPATEEEATIEGAIIDKAYEAYEAWFIKMKEMGVAKAKADNLDPLAGSGLKWFK